MSRGFVAMRCCKSVVAVARSPAASRPPASVGGGSGAPSGRPPAASTVAAIMSSTLALQALVLLASERADQPPNAVAQGPDTSDFVCRGAVEHAGNRP